MNRGTFIMVALAAGSVALAWSARPQPLQAAAYEDTGSPMFGTFSDPTLATALEVVTWDDKAAKIVRFAVEQKAGRWVIPSHNDYPADGTERMGKAAASFIDVKKDIYYGDNPADHAKFGVLDPTGADGKGDEKGKHITIKDAAGAILVDVIVGKAVPGKQEYFYLRAPSEKRVYGARLELDISTNFTDWIEKDLLKVKREEIVALVYDPYVVDEQQGRVINSSPIRADLTQVDGKDEWVAPTEMPLPEGKVFDGAKARQIVTAIASIKIVGVRPRPKQLTLQALQSKGFFVTQNPGNPRLFGNEGEARIVTKDGIVFSLYFGEVTYESGLALTAGGEEEGASEEAPDAAGDGDGDGKDEKAANRYMFVDVQYDPSMDKSGDTPADTPEEDAENAKDKDKDKDKALKGQARAQVLQKRFGEWFYVISDMSFKQIHKDRAEMFKAKPEDKGAEKGKDKPAEGAKPAGGKVPAKSPPAKPDVPNPTSPIP